MRLDSALKKVVPNVSRPKKSRHFLMHWMSVKLPDNFQMREHSWPCRFHIIKSQKMFLWGWFWVCTYNAEVDSNPWEWNIINTKYDSSELREELCPVSSSLPLRVHKVYIRVSFSDTFLGWLPPFVTNSCHYQQR